MNQNEQVEAGASISDFDAPPVDALKNVGLEAEPIEEGPEAIEMTPDGTVIINGETFLNQDAFYKLFIEAHQFGGMIFQLQTLLMAGQIEATRGASDQLYSMILEAEFLHFLIKPSNKYFQMIVAFGAYGLAIVPPIMGELAVKRQARQDAQDQADRDAVNDNEPDAEAVA